MRNIIAVHPDIDMLDEMARLLTEKFPGDVVTEKVRNETDAILHCEAQKSDPYSVVIPNQSIARTFGTSPNDNEDRGLVFLESLDQRGHGDIPKIVVAPTGSNKLFSRIAKLYRCSPLILNEPAKFADDFIELVTAALSDS